MQKDNKEKLKQNKLKVDLKQLVFDLVQELSERPRDIIIKRFGLANNDKKAKTLEKIGVEYGITRERVRQIEFEAISKLKNAGKKHCLNQVFEQIREAVENHGGLAGERKITNHLFGEETGDKEENRQIVLFILSLDGKIKKRGETKTHQRVYFYEQKNIEKFKNLIGETEKHLEANKKELDFDEILEITNKYFKKEPFSFLDLKSYLGENKIILENILGKWGHLKWPQINPKSIRDKAYLALKKNKKPLHFVEITNEINKLWHNKKEANSQTAHNELIKDNRFVLIGRGIYALQEWGYNEGVVLDVIKEILKENNNAMKQNDIIREVLKKRQVKKNTIILNLQNRKYFTKLKEKRFKLK